MSYTVSLLANNVLERAFRDHTDVSPMALQKILYFASSEYAKKTGRPLLDERFSPWRYGPVIRATYSEFKPYGGNPITDYGKDSLGRSMIVDESKDPVLRQVLDDVWAKTANFSAVGLSRITHLPGSAWSRAYQDGVASIPFEYIREDSTYCGPLGLGESLAHA